MDDPEEVELRQYRSQRRYTTGAPIGSTPSRSADTSRKPSVAERYGGVVMNQSGRTLQ